MTCDCDPTLIRPSASPWTCPHGITWRFGVPGDPYCWWSERTAHDCAALGHLYDDDWPWPDQTDMRALAPGSRVGDPCIWCDHEKAAGE